MVIPKPDFKRPFDIRKVARRRAKSSGHYHVSGSTEILGVNMSEASEDLFMEDLPQWIYQ